MSSYCKTVKKIFNPIIYPPLWNNPMQPDETKCLWRGCYNTGGKHDPRGTCFLAPSSEISVEDREKVFNKFLIRKYKDR